MNVTREFWEARVKSDYQEMLSIRGEMIQWKAVKGIPPLVEEYELTLNVRSIVEPGPVYRNVHVVRISLSSQYPDLRPSTRMTSMPGVYHPNWWDSQGGVSNWCEGTWDMTESLGNYVMRMIRTLQFDPDIANKDSPASRKHLKWYKLNENKGIFPTDFQELPDPSKKKIAWKKTDNPPKKKIKFL